MNLSVNESKSETAPRGLGRVASFSIRHRGWVITVWVLPAVLGAVATATSSKRLSFTFDLPGQPAYETNTAIVSTFGSGGNTPPLIVVTRLPDGTTVDSPGIRTQLAQVFDRTSAAVPGARTASWTSTGYRSLVSGDGRTTFQLIYPVADFDSSDPYSVAVPSLQQAVAGQQVGGAAVYVTGSTILDTGGQGGSSSVLVETILAGVGALLVLAVVFGSLLAFLPLLIAAITIPTAFIGVYLFTYVTTMSTLVQNTIALIGLGVAIDYALLIVTRWREERARGRTNRDAVLAASARAGESVVFSGITVMVSLAALALTTVPFLRSIGLAGLLIPLLSIAVSTTLLPVILDGIGPRLEWPRKKPATTVSRSWTAIARWVVRHRVLAAVGSLALLAVLIAPVFSLNLGQPQATATAATAPADARAGLAALTDSGLGAGVLCPTEILLTTAAQTVAGSSEFSKVSPAGWSRGGLSVIDAWSTADPSSATGHETLTAIRAAASAIPGARIGGTPAEDADFISALYGHNLIIIAAAIVLLTLVLLARALRSIWLPVKALLLNVLSLAAAFGVITFVWQQGHGTQTLFSSPAAGAVTLWVPLAMFALLFGLSMDYEVFILTRINEEFAAGHTTDEAVVRGIGHTGRLVTSGALILCLAFVALGGVPQTDVKILSTGLAAGIILDATMIRGVLAPALVALLGSFNWWLPLPVARLLRTTPIERLRAREFQASD